MTELVEDINNLKAIYNALKDGPIASQIDALRSLNKHIHRKEAQLESFEGWLDKEMTK